MEVITGLLITEPNAKPYAGKLVIDEGKIAAIIPVPNSTVSFFIVPGFIDSHAHPIENGLRDIFPDLSPARSVADVLDLIAGAYAQKQNLPVMLAFNFDPDAIKEHRYLYRRELDRLSREKPIFVYRLDGHSGIGNSAALVLIPTTQQEGLELDGAGKPTGVVRGVAFETLTSILKRKLPSEIIKDAITITTNYAISRGITVLAALVGSDELTEAEWQIIVDALSSATIRMEPFLQTWKPEIAQRFGLNRIGGCLLIDGSFGSHTAALIDDYTDAPGFKGILYHRDEKLITFISKCCELGLQTAFHAIGDRAIEQVLKCYEVVVKKHQIKHLRHRIEHAELLSQDLISRISSLGLLLCVQPVFETFWGGPDLMYAQRLGERWRHTSPLRRLVNAGVTVAGGSDAPVTPLDPLQGIKSAISLPNLSESITPEDALALFTTNAAYSLGMDHQVGKLEPGWYADFVILDADPRVNPSCQIIATYCGGRLVYQRSHGK